MVDARFKGEPVLREYLALMDELAGINGGNPLWWGTNLASKHRFLSPLPAVVENDDPRPAWKRCAHKAFQALDVVRHGLRIVARGRKAREVFGSLDGKIAPAYLIKSFAYASSMHGAQFRDPFFGPLAEMIGQTLPEGDVLTVVTDFDESGETMVRMAQTGRKDVLPIEYFIAEEDVVRAVAMLLAYVIHSPFSVPNGLMFDGKDISDSVRRALRDVPGKIDLHHLLHRAAGKRIAAMFALAGCALTYEGNPWERLFVAGLRESRPGLHVVGYQHSVVPPAAAGVFPGAQEVASGVLPDRILTTGEVAARLIRELSAYDDDAVQPFGALRYGYLRELPLKARGGEENFTVLVVPEGVPEAADLVQYALQQAKANPQLHFRVRTHPLTPLSVFLDGEAPENLSGSEYADIVDDMTDCDAVLYWGSTVSLEALMLGTPVIHFDRGDALDYDPLFEFAEFKWRVDDVADLGGIAEVIQGLDDAEYARKQDAGREYIKTYFHVVEAEEASAFLPDSQ